jgi:hypothetical protein
LFRSPLGQALRQPARVNLASYDRLFEAFCSGTSTVPANLDVTGLYFAYHGSFLLERHYAVRVIEISHTDDAILSVGDYISNNEAGKKEEKKSGGCVAFFGGLPHFVIRANDNRLGFNLFIGAETDPSGFESPQGSDKAVLEKLEFFGGTVMGMNARSRQAFIRYCSLVRIPDDSRRTIEEVRSDAIAQTGTFTFDRLSDRHRTQIDGLAERVRKKFISHMFEDPLWERPALEELRQEDHNKLRSEIREELRRGVREELLRELREERQNASDMPPALGDRS